MRHGLDRRTGAQGEVRGRADRKGPPLPEPESAAVRAARSTHRARPTASLRHDTHGAPMHLRDAAAYSHLAAADPVPAQPIERVGRPNQFTCTERIYLSSTKFEIKARHIAAQQISTAAAMTIYRHVSDAAGGAVGPKMLLALPSAEAGYVQELARRQ